MYICKHFKSTKVDFNHTSSLVVVIWMLSTCPKYCFLFLPLLSFGSLAF